MIISPNGSNKRPKTKSIPKAAERDRGRTPKRLSGRLRDRSALDFSWLDLADFGNWDEIVEELESQGFELDGIDEELFIQDIDNFPSDATNWDYMHPQRLFEILHEAEVLDDSGKYDTLMAFLEVRGFREFEELVDRYGADWDDDIYIYKNYDWDDYGREMFNNCGYEIPDSLLDFFDFEAYGESFKYDGIEEYSEGLIEIRR